MSHLVCKTSTPPPKKKSRTPRPSPKHPNPHVRAGTPLRPLVHKTKSVSRPPDLAEGPLRVEEALSQIRGPGHTFGLARLA